MFLKIGVMRDMKNIKTIMVVFALLIVPVISVLGSSIVDIEQKKHYRRL